MKASLQKLPKRKRDELCIINDMIREIDGVEQIILFGSYARGDWVEELGQNGYYKYQSDFDLLIIVDDKKLARKREKWDKLENRIYRSDSIKTPVSIISHNIQYVNQKLSEGHYFFSDIKKEGVLLYDSKNFELAKAREKTAEERQKKAVKYFDNWFNSANDFFEGYDFYLKKEKYKKAAFLLHQTAECFYTAILMVFTDYRPKTHDIELLGKLAAAIETKLVTVFPKGTDEEKRRFELLKSAYVEARYDENYSITREELEWLGKRVSKLQKLAASICKKKLKSVTKIG